MINTETYCDQVLQVVASSGINYLVAWQSDHQYERSYNEGIFAQLLDNEGNKVGSEIQLSIYTSEHVYPSASSNGESYLITWMSDSQDGDESGIYGSLIDLSGNVVKPEFMINTYTTGNQFLPAVASYGSNYLVIWINNFQDISAQFIDQYGNKVDSEFAINNNIFTLKSSPDIIYGDSNYIILWESYNILGSDIDIAVQLIDKNGNHVSPEFLLNHFKTDDQLAPSGIFDGQHFFAVWESEEQDCDGKGIFGTTIDFGYGTNPAKSDSDNDGMNDGNEVYAGMKPNNADSLFTVIECKKENVFDGTKLTWNVTSRQDRIYKIFWKNSLDTEWDQVNYDNWRQDVIDNGNGTYSCIDLGFDLEMNGYGPLDINSRMYKIVVEKIE